MPACNATPARTSSRIGDRVVSTTIPAFAKRELRLDGDQPFTTTSSGAVIAGQMMPPGHMQKE